MVLKSENRLAMAAQKPDPIAINFLSYGTELPYLEDYFSNYRDGNTIDKFTWSHTREDLVAALKPGSGFNVIFIYTDGVIFSDIVSQHHQLLRDSTALLVTDVANITDTNHGACTSAHIIGYDLLAGGLGNLPKFLETKLREKQQSRQPSQ